MTFDEASLLQHVARAADQLVQDLADAQAESDGWQDERRAGELVFAALDDCLASLADTGCWGEANRVPSSRLWQIAGSWLEVGWLQHRARFKPRGYAGDFEMLAAICHETLCEHPLGRIFDRYFQSQQAPRAVRNRTRLVADAIAATCRKGSQVPARIASIGSGPALDVRWAVDALRVEEIGTLDVTLVDRDPAALEHARQLLATRIAGDRLDLVRENLFRLNRRAVAGELLGGCDLIACTGLFDYLQDADAAALLECLWQALAPGGRLLVFNFAPQNTSRAYMEWIGNWYLIYRSRQQMQTLADRAGIPRGCLSIEAEATGVDLYWDARQATADGDRH